MTMGHRMGYNPYGKENSMQNPTFKVLQVMCVFIKNKIVNADFFSRCFAYS